MGKQKERSVRIVTITAVTLICNRKYATSDASFITGSTAKYW